jgi:hypothetical protein
MSGLLFLSSEDFTLNEKENGHIMCLDNVLGFSLILFYSTECQFCQNLIPIFKKLPGTIGGCNFGMINVSNNRECVMMSRETNSEIKVVPFIILYINGEPYMRYQGGQTEKEITNFIIDVSDKLKNEKSFVESVEEPEKKSNQIPAYSIGKPKTSKVCYLSYSKAYSGKKDK